jgi:pimeloyl-ACP methyl ester carboxylesterase
VRDETIASPAFAERGVEADGVRIRFAEAGQGTPLVHFPGEGGLRLTPAHDLLCRHFRVMVFDMAAADPTRGLASTMARALDTLGLDTFSLMGTSAGATAALGLALEASSRVQALVLEAPTTIRPDARDAELERRLAGLATPTLVLLGTADTVVSPAIGRVYKERLPAGHLVFVYDAGHAISTDRPEAFTEVVVDFLERREAFVISRATTLINP